ncbi:AraC family transcriptional regulator [Paenibacillus pinistramenti]|uniref:AraC family transcriptional regulator n=1 Tax=Paenibacillus pinistramenti TaxID=1768003 RepID=UPI00110984AB|nr:AraC family transcriptional regulator [Paenibacillus pinistramenti]
MFAEQHLSILAAGYSVHRKAYKSNDVNGPEHYLIRLQTEGKAKTRIAGELVNVEMGDVLLFSPSEPYELYIDSVPFSSGSSILSGDYYIFIDGSWIKEWWNGRKRPNKIRMPLTDAFINLFRQISLEQQRVSKLKDDIAAHYIQILCLEIDRQLEEQPRDGQRSYLAYQLKHFVEENAATAFRLEDAAAHAGISVSRAVHLFKATFGQSIIQYATDIRLNMARERIIFSPLSLEHVAESSGFPSYNYFHKVFRSKFGMSPKQYRLASRENTK